jgi:hypothetical protein
MTALILADIGAKALYLLLVWLASATAASYLSERKGYGDKLGLASGLLLTVLGPIIWLFVPPRANSDWTVKGAFGNRRKDDPDH